MTEPAKPYTDAQIAGIERVAALAAGATVPRLLASLVAMRTERDEARALLDQQAALHAEAERIDRSAIDRCAALAERVGVLSAEVDDVRGDLADAEAEIIRWRVGSAGLEAERDEALAHVGTLLAIVERVADRLTAEDGADVAALVVRVARERQAEREALARAGAERDALRAAVQTFCANASVCFVTDCKDHPHDWRTLAALLPCGVAPFLACKEDDL